MLFPISENQMAGFIDEHGEIAIKPKFERTLPFSEGVAAARLNFHWGFIDTRGDWVIEPTFSLCAPFSDGFSAVSIAGEKAYIDRTGSVVLEGPFYECGDFSGGIACVRRDRMDDGTLITQEGKRIGDAVYPLCRMTHGLINCVDDRGRWGYANAEGTFQITPEYKGAWPFSEGLAAVTSTESGEYQFIDTYGAVAISHPYQGAELEFQEGLCPVWKGGAGYIDLSGQMKIPPRFQIANAFSEGLAVVQGENSRLLGYIDYDGEIVIEYQFTTANAFRRGLAQVGIGELQFPSIGYINRNGEFVWGPCPC